MAKCPFDKTGTAGFRHRHFKSQFEAGAPYSSDIDRNRAVARDRYEAEQEARKIEDVGCAVALGVKSLVLRVPELNRWPRFWREQLANKLADVAYRVVVRWLAWKASK
ncbi:hypothetical protein [Chthonobacter rhizosphaerae]|uniref:hypothetical protein n=1 Tax=Chthonobacter rhizosphaerae TaxID=2735553 RepID=UPI0015EEAE52|nr:hypothetical protein [Chthonobacter rhizosphaerae]